MTDFKIKPLFERRDKMASSVLSGACCIKNRFQDPQASWSFILPDGLSIPMIIDSGASFSFLSRGAWQKTSMLMKPVDINIQKNSQVRSPILGFVEDITFKHPPDTVHFDKLLVVDSPEVALYLNFLTLAQLGASIDFSNGILNINLKNDINSVSAPPPQMSLTDLFASSQNQKNFQDTGNHTATLRGTKAKSRSKSPLSKDRTRRRSHDRNRRDRSRDRSAGRDKRSKTNLTSVRKCFKCRKTGHEGRNCPLNGETLKVETRFASGKNEPEKHERNPRVIPPVASSTNMRNTQRPNIEPKKNLPQDNRRDDSFDKRPPNVRRDLPRNNSIGNNQGIPTHQTIQNPGQPITTTGKSNTMTNRNQKPPQHPRNLSTITLQPNQNTNLQNQHYGFYNQHYSNIPPQPFQLNTNPHNYMSNQVPVQSRMSNFMTPMFNQGGYGRMT